MKESIMRLVRRIPFCYPLKNWRTRRNEAAALAAWEKKGRPIPPPHRFKQDVLREYARQYGLRILVETGTYNGDMIQAMRDEFDRLYSIELSQALYEKARFRFRGIEKIVLIQGDSGTEIKGVLEKINQPALFWLDSHYSAGVTARGATDTPIFDELEHILCSKIRNHVMIVDDARNFGTDPAYPSLEELSRFVNSKRSDVDLRVQDDSIRITPRCLRLASALSAGVTRETSSPLFP